MPGPSPPSFRRAPSLRETGSTSSRLSGFSSRGLRVQRDGPRTRPANIEDQSSNPTGAPLPHIICNIYASISSIYYSEPSTSSYSLAKPVERTRLGLGMAPVLPDETHVSLRRLQPVLPRPPKASLTARSSCSCGRVMRFRTSLFLVGRACTISAMRVGSSDDEMEQRFRSQEMRFG